MSVAAWDGVYLAVDSRLTRSNSLVSDDSLKIDTSLEGISFKGSPIMAVARAGNVRTTRTMTTLLRQHNASLVAFTEQFPPSLGCILKRGSLFIVTEESAWLWRLTPTKGFTLKEYRGKEKVAFGSGGRIAEYLMEAFFLTPQQAVAATLLHSKSCGGPVRYVKCRERSSVGQLKIKTTSFLDINALRTAVFTAVRRKCRRLLGL